MGIGIPGSGKTTALKPFAEQNAYVYISADTLRLEFNGNEANHANNKAIWEEAHRRTANALREGKTVVFDATFAKDFERKDFIQFVREQGAEKVQGVYADIPFEVANERNMARERVVPEYAMHQMHNMLQKNPPQIEDGFDSIFTIDELQKLESAELKVEGRSVTREFKPKLS